MSTVMRARGGTPLSTTAISRPTVGTRIRSVVERGRSLEHGGQKERARQHYEAALHDGTAATPGDAAQLLRLVARTYLQEANYDAAIDCTCVALEVAERSGDEGARGHALNILAIIEWNRGNLDSARSLYLTARDSALRAGDARLGVMTASNLGVISNVHGDEDAARAYYESALSQARGAGLADLAIGALINLGLLYTQSGRFGPAQRHLLEACELCTIIGDRSLLITAELHLAKLRIKQDNRADARASCDRVRAIVTQIGDSREAGEAQYVYGLVERASGDNTAAEAHFLRAEEIAIERSDLILQGELAR